MDYEKKYYNALIAVKKLQEANPNDEGIQNWIDDSFPELKESEDEKVRNELIDAIRGLWENDALPMPLSVERKDKWIAWLEKQGEPDGKRAEWINGVLTLVDEQKVDNRPVTERIKTFEDAREALGDEHPLVKEYWGVVNVDLDITQDLIAYLKLRIIVAALNEGWEPKFTEDEYRYFPWFYFYTKEEYDKLNDEEKGRCVLRSGNYAYSHYGFVCCFANYDASFSHGYFGSRLSFRTRELAAYAGGQFTEEWADFIF